MEWNLQLPKGGGASPRCFAVVPAPRTTPFKALQGGSPISAAVTVAFGTDRGSFHTRTYALSNNTATTAWNSNNNSSSNNNKQGPITAAQGGGSHRSLLPADLGSLPGPVVHCIPLFVRGSTAAGRKSSTASMSWLLWIMDDTTATDRSTSYTTRLVATGSTKTGFQMRNAPPSGWPRMSCASYVATTSSSLAAMDGTSHGYLVYAMGRSIHTWSSWDNMEEAASAANANMTSSSSMLQFPSLPSPGVRSGPDALLVLGERTPAPPTESGGLVVLVAVGHTVHAVVGTRPVHAAASSSSMSSSSSSNANDAASIRSVLSFSSQSSLVHPVILLDLHDPSKWEDRHWHAVFLASGRECAVVDFDRQSLHASPPRNGMVTVNSPILSATACHPYTVLLQSDGLVSLRSASCLAISLRTIEIGQRPNDYFCLRTIPTLGGNAASATSFPPAIVAAAYSGECQVRLLPPDTPQERTDRLVRLAVDAGFSRNELTDALGGASSSYVHSSNETSSAPAARLLLKQYLEAVLGLTDWEGGGGRADLQPLLESVEEEAYAAAEANYFAVATAVLCWVASQLVPPVPAVAHRAAQSAAQRRGLVLWAAGAPASSSVPLCGRVAEQLLREASLQITLGSSAGARKSTEFVEAAIWLLRLGGQHERAMEVAMERLQPGGTVDGGGVRGFWSSIKYDSYMATHLSELWSAGKEEAYRLVLSSPAMLRLLERNPPLGLSVFMARHPQNEGQWRALSEDPLAQAPLVHEILSLLKSIQPAVVSTSTTDPERPLLATDGDMTLPLESGRALTVSFLRSAMGIATGRPFMAEALLDTREPSLVNFHDELALLLLEGVILERSEGCDVSSTDDSALGGIYRSLLREYLQWPLAQLRPEAFMEALPPTFLQEKALVLGRLGQHEEALRILYGELNSLDLALAYCDHRYARQKQHYELNRKGNPVSPLVPYTSSDHLDPALEDFAIPKGEDNAYLPLVRVALESPDITRGTNTAIQVLALRRGAVDRAAALRLLPADVPVSAVARPFLIPALVDSASQVRRMTVVSALLRARYGRLKEELLTAQLKAQEKIQVVPALQSLQLGEAIHSSKSARARTTSATPGSTMPFVEIVKYFFPRHLVIQAKVTNIPYSSSTSALSDKPRPILSDITFVVAESSEDEAIVPLLQVPIQCLPPQRTGSAWFVLSASPSLMEAPTALLTCELRYSVGGPDGWNNAPAAAMTTAALRSCVEELQDIEIHAAHFLPKGH